MTVPDVITNDIIRPIPMIMPAEILRGAVRRFFPGALVGAIATSLVLGPVQFVATMWPRWIGGSLGAAALATLGFAAAIVLTRRFLRMDADIGGSKSVVAGFVAAGVTFSILAFSSSFLVMTVSLFRLSPFYIGRTVAIPILAGFVATIALYFPWLSRTPEQITPANKSADLMTGAARFMLRRRSIHTVRQEEH